MLLKSLGDTLIPGLQALRHVTFSSHLSLGKLEHRSPGVNSLRRQDPLMEHEPGCLGQCGLQVGGLQMVSWSPWRNQHTQGMNRCPWQAWNEIGPWGTLVKAS